MHSSANFQSIIHQPLSWCCSGPSFAVQRFVPSVAFFDPGTGGSGGFREATHGHLPGTHHEPSRLESCRNLVRKPDFRPNKIWPEIQLRFALGRSKGPCNNNLVFSFFRPGPRGLRGSPGGHPRPLPGTHHEPNQKTYEPLRPQHHLCMTTRRPRTLFDPADGQRCQYPPIDSVSDESLCRRCLFEGGCLNMADFGRMVWLKCSTRT